MKNYTNRYTILFSFLLAMMLFSCSPMDEYKDFITPGEVQYPGKIDSVIIYPGDKRLVVKGLFVSDPKISNCRIYWNLRGDSVDVPVNRTAGVDTLKKELSLPENSYSFEIFTYDDAGNRSVPVTATGQTYGDQYKASINNRLIKSYVLDDDSVVVEWRGIDATLGAFATELTYSDKNGMMRKVRATIQDEKTTLKDIEVATEVSYTTLYLPDKLCIDTFRTNVNILVIE